MSAAAKPRVREAYVRLIQRAVNYPMLRLIPHPDPERAKVEILARASAREALEAEQRARGEVIESERARLAFEAVRQREREATKPDVAPTKLTLVEESSIEQVRSTVCKWWPGHWPLVEVQLAACMTLLLKDVGQGLALFAIGPSGSGKNTSLKMFGVPERDVLIHMKAGLDPLVEQLDGFTLASFLSHYSEEKRETLERGALYHRLKHRVLLTAELAPIFRGNRATLETMFSKLALVLDGEGLRTSAGTHGILGQKGDYTFVWLGGTTPFRMETWRTMAQLGTRLLFYRVADDVAQCPDEDYQRARDECNRAVFNLLSTLVSADRRRSLAWPRIGEEQRATLRDLAELLAAGQAQGNNLSEDEPIRPSPNHFRMRLTLIVCGRALLYGRDVVDASDIDVCRHIVRSSMPGSRGPVLVALHEAGPQTAAQLSQAIGLAHQYVLKTLHALKEVEVVREGAKGEWSLNLS